MGKLRVSLKLISSKFEEESNLKSFNFFLLLNLNEKLFSEEIDIFDFLIRLKSKLKISVNL